METRPESSRTCHRHPCETGTMTTQASPKTTSSIQTMTDVNSTHCTRDGSFFCHSNTKYCHIAAYRELCCKTCKISTTPTETHVPTQNSDLLDYENLALDEVLENALWTDAQD